MGSVPSLEPSMIGEPEPIRQCGNSIDTLRRDQLNANAKGSFDMGLHTRFAVVVASISLASNPAHAASCVGVAMPNRTSIDGTPLVLNGMGVREVTFLKLDVYVAGLYLERRSDDGKAIAYAEQVKQMRLTFVRDVGRDDMVAELDQAFRKAAGSEYEKLRTRFEALKSWLPALQPGDKFVTTYRPGKGLEVRHNARLLGIVPGADFARTVFLAWLGDHPPNAGLKA
ncbi:chalcone isomerase family protein, partial [Myxococcota bacterium]